jgi:hypothetical protein
LASSKVRSYFLSNTCNVNSFLAKWPVHLQVYTVRVYGICGVRTTCRFHKFDFSTETAATMGAYKYMSELYRKKQSDVMRYLLRIRCWQYRQLARVHRVPRSTRPDKARRLGYKNKQGKSNKSGIMTMLWFLSWRQ